MIKENHKSLLGIKNAGTGRLKRGIKSEEGNVIKEALLEGQKCAQHNTEKPIENTAKNIYFGNLK